MQSKIDLYVNRFLLVQQRVKRHPLFRHVPFDGIMENGGNRDIAELTELKALLGLVGQRRYVLGFLTQKEAGKYYIEDLSARLPLDLSAAETSDGLFTENSIVVAEGELTPGGTFRAVALGLPPAEPREDSLAALQGLDFFGGKPFHSGLSDYAPKRQLWETEFQDDRVIFLSDVELDRPAVIERLHVVFKGFSALDPPPSTFVLMGNFQSYDANTPTANFSAIRENFALLARVISKYPVLRSNQCQFLIIPGPGDLCPGQNILPRPPLPKSVVQPLLEVLPGNVKCCSNPCRIRHGPAELVLFRCNLQRRMRSLCILDTQRQMQPQIQGSLKSTAFDQLCATLLQESHLCPLPLEYQTVAWEWDHSLWLYPLPNALVVADSDLESSRFTFDTTTCLNPGSIAHGTFGAWQPTSNEMELCDVENDMTEADEEGDEVEDEDEGGEGQGMIGREGGGDEHL